MTILITGGCGFLGHHMVEHFIKNTDWNIVILDKLTYASNGFDRLRDINCFDDKRVKVLTSDFAEPLSSGIRFEIGYPEYILHLGAETHVDNSIIDAIPFVKANMLGTTHILDLARDNNKLIKMIYFSTDEVFGPAAKGVFHKEWDHYKSSNPYAASKAGGEEMCIAYHNTHKVPVVITHCMNLFGERQHPEKFIPMCINKIRRGEVIPIHASPDLQVSGSRFYIHCRNVANAIHFLLDKGEAGDKYNIVGEKELSNLDVALFIGNTLGIDVKYKMINFHSSRPGHDLRYALDGRKLDTMGWKIPIDFEDSLVKTIRWFVKNPKWLGG